MLLPVGVVGLAGINLLRVLGVGIADGQRLPALAAFEQTGEHTRLPRLSGTLAGFQLFLHDGKVRFVI